MRRQETGMDAMIVREEYKRVGRKQESRPSLSLYVKNHIMPTLLVVGTRPTGTRASHAQWN